MVTVSTHANDTPGFTLFVDGQQVGPATSGLAAADHDGQAQHSARYQSVVISVALSTSDYWAAVQVAELSPSTKLNNGSAAAVTGGDPARLADDIVLCARSDLDEDRCRRRRGRCAVLCCAVLCCAPLCSLHSAVRCADPVCISR